MSEAEVVMDAAAEMLRLRLEPDYRPGVVANLEVAMKMAKLVEGFELDEEAEPAPVYRP